MQIRFFKTISSTKGTQRIKKKEVECLVLLLLLEIAHESKWVAPSFAQPKPKKHWVRFISDF